MPRVSFLQISTMKVSLLLMTVLVGVSLLLTMALSQSNAEIFRPKGQFVKPKVFHQGMRAILITSGSEVAPHSLPYQVYISTASTYEDASPCGASLISRKYVLTAAHCIDDAITVEVVLGAHNINENEASQVKLTATKFIIHENWNPSTMSNDIALIELPSEVELTEAINIIGLPTRAEAESSFSGSQVRISGWGLTSGTGGLSPVLLSVDLTVIDNTICNSFYGIVRGTQLCTSGGSGKGVCTGDSGGPLVETSINKQIGIVSYGVAGCLDGYPSGYTRVGEYLDWIEEHSDVNVL